MHSLSLYKHFSFPLNVYAHVLEKEDGRVDYLHYGLFDREGISANEAQANSSELLWHNLPPPCKLLEVGIGLGTTLARLCREGYSATGITPDASQIAYARNRYGEGLPAVCTKLEDYCEAAGQWDAVLFQESAQYVDPIDLFEAVGRLLVADGKVVVVDEFALKRTENHKEGLHYLEHFLRLAERAGFSLETRIDLSKLATPTLDWLLAAVKRHRGTLHNELGVSEESLEALETSNRIYREKYVNGQFGYFLLSFKRVSQPGWRVGRILPQRSQEMRVLFSDVFGHEMSEAHWQWKYGDGRGAGIGVWRNDGRLVAHYGGTSRDILFFGQPATASQVGDVMVAASERGTLSRKGPVFLAAASFLEHELGYGAPHLLGVGFPNERAFRLPERLGLYSVSLGRIQEVAWPALRTRPSLRHTVREFASRDAGGPTLMDCCWQAMAGSLGAYAVGIRDAAYLQRRYAEHPDKQYRFFAVCQRFTGRPLGLLVLRVAEVGRCELLDVVGALADLPYLVHQARRVTAALGCGVLFAWLVDNLLPVFHLPAEARVQDLGVLVPGNNWTEGPDNTLVAGKWWLTGGDTDFH